MELYVQQTVPVLKAHLMMAENLKKHISEASTETRLTTRARQAEWARRREMTN